MNTASRKVYTADDLVPGLALVVRNQGRCITPQPLQLTIHWVGPKDVHYIVEGSTEIRETPIERFLDILNS